MDTAQKPLPGSDWALLNDGNADTEAVLNNDVELDLGDGGVMSDKIKVVFSKTNMTSINGSVLFVMDNDRKVIFENLFVGITANSPTTQEFPLATLSGVVPIPDAETAVICYLRLTRTSPGIGTDGGPDVYMNVIKLEGLLGTHAHAYLYTENMQVLATVLRIEWNSHKLL